MILLALLFLATWIPNSFWEYEVAKVMVESNGLQTCVSSSIASSVSCTDVARNVQGSEVTG